MRVALYTICSGTCTTSGPSSRCRAARCCRESGRRGSHDAWRGPSRRAGQDRARRTAPPARAHTPIDTLETEIAELVGQVAPQLLSEPGFGPLTAAKLIGEIAGARRFSATPSSPAPAGSHRFPSARATPTAIASTAAAIASSTPPSTASPSPRARCHPETRAYLDRKRAEGKSTTEAIRCLKRHLARRIWHLLIEAAPPANDNPTHHPLDIGATEAGVQSWAPALPLQRTQAQARGDTA